MTRKTKHARIIIEPGKRLLAMASMTDTERIDWLEQLVREGACPALVNDDAGRWALAFDGMQNVPNSKKAIDIQTTFWIKAKDWHHSIRQAIDATRKARETK